MVKERRDWQVANWSAHCARSFRGPEFYSPETGWLQSIKLCSTVP